MTTPQREIYWKRNARYARQQELLALWPAAQDANREAIRSFQEHLLANRTGKYRVAKITAHLRRICEERATLCLPTATKEDIRGVVAWINTYDGWKAHSKVDYTRVLKHFYHWFEDEDPRLHDPEESIREAAQDLYKYLKKYVKISKPRKKVGEDEIITDADLAQLQRAGCRTPLERAFLGVLHNSGARIAEMLNIRIRDYERKGKHALLRVDGKTGERRIPILQAIPALEEWLRIHPDHDNPGAYIWVSMSERHYGKPLAYLGVLKLLRRVFLRARIAKQHNPHWFRHSRASIWARDFSQAMLCNLMGWEQGSAQAQTYIHVGARDVEDSFLKAHGILPQEQRRPVAQYCACGETNTAESRYCYKCGQPLSVSVVLQEQEYLKRAFELLPRVLEDPELRKRYESKLQEYTRENPS